MARGVRPRPAASWPGAVERLVGRAVLQRLGLGCQQQGTPAAGHRPVEQVLALGEIEGAQRILPVAGAARQVEQGLHRPAEPGVQAQGPLGVVPRRFALTLALGLQEQAVQAELGRIAGAQHGLEDAPGGGPVAAGLGRLGAQEQCQGLVRQRLAGLGGVALGQRPIAGAEGNEAARQRLQPPLLPTAVDKAGDGCRGLPEVAQEPPADQRRGEQQAEQNQAAQHADFGDMAQPLDGDGAGPPGQPVQPGGEDQDGGEIQDGADHCFRSGPASDDLRAASTSATAVSAA